MRLATVVIGVLASFLILLPALEAYYFGAGGCTAGVNGVGPPHGKGVAPTDNTQVITGSLAVGGFSVSVDGKTITPGAVTKVTIKKFHLLSVKAATSKFFRGFSLRLALKEPLFTGLTPLAGDSSTQSNYVCVGYGAVGITHTNNNTKTVAKGNLTIAKAASNVPLDVIIVVQNRNKKSIYYYTEYKLTFA